MEKESLISSLKERIGENDFNAISRRSVENIIEPLLPLFADDEKVTEETYAIPVAMLKSFIGQTRHDIAESIKTEREALESRQKDAVAKAVKDAVEAERQKWESKSGERVTHPDPSQANDTPDVDSVIDRKISEMLEKLTGSDGAIGKLTSTVETFITDAKKRRKAEMEASIKERITAGLENMGADNSTIIELAIEKLEIGDNPEYSTLFSQAKAEYEAYYKKLYANGPTPFAGAPGESGSDKQFRDFIAKRQEEAEQQAKDAEALRGKMI